MPAATSEISFEDYIKENKPVVRQTSWAYDWRRQTNVEQELCIVRVQGGATNNQFHLIDQVRGQCVVDQQNIRFQKPYLAESRVSHEGSALIIGGMINHWHFLINFLPRLIFCDKVQPLLMRQVDHVVIHKTQPQQQTLLKALFPHIKFVEIDQHKPVEVAFDEIYYPSFFYNTALNYQYLDLTRDRVLRSIPELDVFPDRIFIDRNPKVPRRRLAQRDVALRVFKKYVVKPIFTENMDFGQQVNAMRHADIVGGIHGAGMANMLFCQPATPVLIIDYKSPSEMHGLAKVMGLRPVSIVGRKQPVKGIEPRLSDINVDAQDLEAALAQVITA